MKNPLQLSVVIATYRREKVLCETLRQVLEQADEQTEVIVVDQSESHDSETETCLRGLEATQRIRWIRLSKPNACVARNTGVELAQAPIVLFLDDDVILKPKLLQHHLANYSDLEVSAVQGQCIERRQFQQVTDKGDPLDWRRFTLNYCQRAITNRVASGNFSARKAALIAVGGFDVRFGGNFCGEDLDLGLRLTAAGFRIIFDPTASLDHLAAEKGGTRTCAVPRLQFYSLVLVHLRHSRGTQLYRALFYELPRVFVVHKKSLRRPWTIIGLAVNYVRAVAYAARILRT